MSGFTSLTILMFGVRKLQFQRQRVKVHEKRNYYSKTCVKWPLSKRAQIGFQKNYPFIQVKSIVEHSAILSTFIKLPFIIKIFVLSVFEWPFYTGFTVQ